MRYVQTTVTPEMATSLLDQNTSNRPLSQSNVDFFVGLLKRGEFRCTHQGIAIDWDNILQDGQHRLYAIVESGVSADVMLATNCDPANFASIDTGGRKRTASDILGYNAKDLQVSAAFFWLNETSHLAPPTPTQLSVIHELFAPKIEALRAVAAPRRTIFGSSMSRAICVLRAHTGLQDYAFNIYAGLNKNMPGNLPPIAQGFYKAVMDKRVGNDRAEIAARMWYVTDPARSENTRVQVTNNGDAMAVIRDTLRRVAPDVFTV